MHSAAHDHASRELSADVVIYGGSPSGILAAVRAAREGLTVVLVSVTRHLGGTMANGLSSWDTQYGGRRSPLVDELTDRIRAHYRDTYGQDSDQYRQCINGPFAAGKWEHLVFEPKVAERILEELVAAEGDRIHVERGVEVIAVARSGRRISSISCTAVDGSGRRLAVRGSTFVDATYELDLGAIAGIAYHVGRESREEFGEQHAGRLFMHRSGAETDHPEAGQLGRMRYPRDAAAGLLDIRPWWGVTQEIFSQSTGEGDGAVQAYNFRVVLSSDPANRVPIVAPAGYDRARFTPITAGDDPNRPPERYPIKTDLLINPLRGMPAKLPLPNQKCDWNAAAIPGGVDEYPDASWSRRHEIMEEHRDHALGLLYFLQNDESVPHDVRAECAQWGLAADEFTDNGNFPYEIYVREARRLRGRKIFTEHDARFARGIERTPIHEDSIAIAEWLLDSHDCTTDRMLGSYGDGWTSLSELTRPSQIPYSCMLPVEVDNLIVSVCVSSTHVGWGTLRLEPVWTQLGEVAGHAAALAMESGTDVGTLNVRQLQRRLVERHGMVSFFNYIDISDPDVSWNPAVQFMATKGFSWSYDLDLEVVLREDEANAWIEVFAKHHGSSEALPDSTRTAAELRRLSLAPRSAARANISAILAAVESRHAGEIWTEGFRKHFRALPSTAPVRRLDLLECFYHSWPAASAPV